MSDQLFIKRIGARRWIGLRLPHDIQIKVDKEGKASVTAGWAYDPATPWPAGVEIAWIPALAATATAANADVTAWREVKRSTHAAQLPLPFADFAQAAEDDEVRRKLMGPDVPDTDLAQRFAEQLATLKTAPSVPLRALHAYRLLEPSELEPLGGTGEPPIKLLARLHEALGGLPHALTIDLFSGLLFVVEAYNVAPGADVFVDSVMQPAPSRTLTLVARQAADRVTLQLSTPKGPMRNDELPVFLGSDNVHAPWYRMTRSLGVDGRQPARTGLIIIPLEAPGELQGVAQPTVPAPGNVMTWKQRPFRIVDPLGSGLVGELLRYDVELFNAHGRRLSSLRLLVVRRDLSPPGPPTRGTARLRVDSDAKLQDVEIRLDLGPAEEQGLRAGDLKLIVYGLASRRIPTGFYGDADDAALAIGRLLSDLDPAAVLASGAASARVADALPELANLRLSARELDQLVVAGFADLTRRTDEDRKKDADDEVWQLVLARDTLKLAPSDGLRLFIALRRELDPETRKGVVRQIESTVLPLELGIADAATDCLINVVQHFENFWSSTQPMPVVQEHHCRVFRLPDAAAEPLPRGVTGALRIEIDHATVASLEGGRDIGGYRLWMRETAGSEMPWQAVAVVQVLPPLVKAYAPIETGRQWRVETAPTGAPDGTTSFPEFDATSSRRFFRVDGTRVSPVDAAKAPPTGYAPASEKEARELADTVASVARDGTCTSLLKLLKTLTEKGFAAEYILSVAQRRRLERRSIRNLQQDADAVPAADNGALPAGNWMLFKDQNGHMLGRAFSYWGDAVGVLQLHAHYTLVEMPNVQDTVATDDFGKASWTWQGLTDAWGHDFEWVVEPLHRHAPLLQRIRTPQPDDLTDPARQATGRNRYRDTPFDPGRHTVLSLRVQRTAPLGGEREGGGTGISRFGIVQRFPKDVFAFDVFAPDEFRLSTHNAVARSAYGVLRAQVRDDQRAFDANLQKHFGEAVKLFLAAWVGEDKAEEEKLPTLAWSEGVRFDGDANNAEPSARTPVFARLVIDEPDCLTLDFKLVPMADAVEGGATSVVAARRRSPGFEGMGADGAPPAPDGWPTLKNRQELRIPVPRLGWSYAGVSNPPLSLLDHVPQELDDKCLLRLPDPNAAVYVQRREAGDTFRLVAIFLGDAIEITPGMFPDLQGGTSGWGTLRYDEALFMVSNGLQPGSPPTIKLDLQIGKDQDDLRVSWRRGAAEQNAKVL